jgi:phosphatidyl-myo-inositol dimannoside synthase
VLARHPDVHYLIVGGGPYRAQLDQLIVARQLSGSVSFAGTVPDEELLAHYALADLFVMPHRELPSGDTEGFGVVFLEANACGVPVIAGRTGGARDAVEDQVNGLTVDGEDVDAITQAILRILDDPALRERLRTAGLARARAADCRDSAARFLALCRRVVGTSVIGCN